MLNRVDQGWEHGFAHSLREVALALAVPADAAGVQVHVGEQDGGGPFSEPIEFIPR